MFSIHLLRCSKRTLRRSDRLRSNLAAWRARWRLSVFYALVDAEELGDDHVVEGAKVNDTQDCVTYKEAALTETAYVTDPIEDVVDLSIDDL